MGWTNFLREYFVQSVRALAVTLFLAKAVLRDVAELLVFITLYLSTLAFIRIIIGLSFTKVFLFVAIIMLCIAV